MYGRQGITLLTYQYDHNFGLLYVVYMRVKNKEKKIGTFPFCFLEALTDFFLLNWLTFDWLRMMHLAFGLHGHKNFAEFNSISRDGVLFVWKMVSQFWTNCFTVLT